MTDIMVDLETTDTDPDAGGVIQLAAIKFNLETLSVGGVFDRCPLPLPRRRWSDGTKHFWMVQNRPFYDKIVERQENYGPVYSDFVAWVQNDAPAQGYRFWAKPVKFDWPFLESQYLQLGIPFPFPHWQAFDVHSYIAGLRGEVGRVDIEREVEFKGVKHNALHDAAYQIELLFHAKRHHIHAEVL